MGNRTGIEWTDHTFNPWWGCQKVSPGCTNCYAETLSKRFGRNIWGPPHATDRRTFGDKHWRDPIRWNAAAERAGRRAKVFCASMADVFEEHDQVVHERLRLWRLIEATPHLDWQLLTKRPENVRGMVPELWNLGTWPHNVWIGTSVEDQERANERVPVLLEIPAALRFLSCEPLLGPVTLRPEWIDLELQAFGASGATAFPRVDWIIVGGESGTHARPMHPDWARDLIRQAQTAGVPAFMKQLGAWIAADHHDATHLVHVGGPARKAAYIVERDKATTERRHGYQGQYVTHEDLVDRGHPGWTRMRRTSSHNGDPQLWPAELRVREFPEAVAADA